MGRASADSDVAMAYQPQLSRQIYDSQQTSRDLAMAVS